ncbi:MAG: transcriptional regulator BetI [Pseudomonadota bacterium]
MPKLGMAEIRKPQLIDATMRAIDSVGLARANVTTISGYAGVTPAIINHYFGGKDGLLAATMREILEIHRKSVREQLARIPHDDVVGRIMAIVGGNFSKRYTNSPVVKTWLTFWAQAMHEPMLSRLQQVNERRLLSHLKLELKRVLPPDRALLVARAVAALIDGIWLRGALNPNGIDARLAQDIILDYLSLNLPQELIQRYHAHNIPADDEADAVLVAVER